MARSIRFPCPHCGARIKAPFQLVGKVRDCPRCKHRLIVQLKPPEDAGPVLLGDDLSASGLRWLTSVS
jgi:hypothetical protein